MIAQALTLKLPFALNEISTYCFTLGLPDSKVNRTVAEQKARQIELDIISGNFDESLRKYKPQSQKYTRAIVSELYELFMSHKSADISEQIPENYDSHSKVVE